MNKEVKGIETIVAELKHLSSSDLARLSSIIETEQTDRQNNEYKKLVDEVLESVKKLTENSNFKLRTGFSYCCANCDSYYEITWSELYQIIKAEKGSI